MAFKHTLKRGSTRPVLRYPLPGVDLTGASVTFLMSPRPGQLATVNAPAVVANGVLEYHWQHGDTDNAVMHYGEFEVVFPGGAIETFPNDDYIRIEVKQDIGDGGSVAPPALIVLSAALVEVGADMVSGSASVGIGLSGAMTEGGSDTASGSMSVTTPAPGSISLSAALVEAGADTASGAASVGIAMSAAMAEVGADTAMGAALVGITVSAAMAESGGDTAFGSLSVSAPTVTTTGYIMDGDSLTGGTILPRYPEILAQVTGKPITNKAVPGKKLSELNATFDSRGMAALYNASTQNTLVLLAGINDILSTAGITLATMQADMTAYVGKAKAAGFRVLVGTLMPATKATGAKDTLRLDFNAWLRSEASNLGIEIFDLPSIPALNDATEIRYFLDGLHPGPRGNAKIAEAVRALSGVPALPDTTPEPFAFPSVAKAALSYFSESDPIEVRGTSSPAPITVNGGEYSINGGEWTSLDGLAMPYDLVSVRVATPAAEGQTVSATLTIGGVSGTFTATTLTVDPSAPAGMFYPLDKGEGTLLRDDSGRLPFVKGASVTWRTAPVGVRYGNGLEIYARARVDDPGLLTKPLLVGVAFRLEGSVSSRVLLSSDEAGGRIFSLRFKSGRLSLEVIPTGGSTVTIQEASASVAVGEWHMATAFIGTASSQLRRDGVEVATGSHATRTSRLGPRPFVALGATGNPFSPGNYPDAIQGDIIAVGITPDATSGMIPAFEAKLRAIATAKGITLP